MADLDPDVRSNSPNAEPLGSFSTSSVGPANKLNADQYSAEDIDGVTESVFGSGNLNSLTLQASQTDDSSAANQATVDSEDGASKNVRSPDIAASNDPAFSVAAPAGDIESGETGSPIHNGAVPERNFSDTESLSNDIDGDHQGSPNFGGSLPSFGGGSVAGGSAGGTSGGDNISNVTNSTSNTSNTVTENINAVIDDTVTQITNLGDNIIQNAIEGDVTEIVDILSTTITDITQQFTTEVNNVLQDLGITETVNVEDVLNQVTNVFDSLGADGLSVDLATGVLNTVDANIHAADVDGITIDVNENLSTDNLFNVVDDTLGASSLEETGLTEQGGTLSADADVGTTELIHESLGIDGAPVAEALAQTGLDSAVDMGFAGLDGSGVVADGAGVIDQLAALSGLDEAGDPSLEVTTGVHDIADAGLDASPDEGLTTMVDASESTNDLASLATKFAESDSVSETVLAGPGAEVTVSAVVGGTVLNHDLAADGGLVVDLAEQLGADEIGDSLITTVGAAPGVAASSTSQVTDGDLLLHVASDTVDTVDDGLGTLSATGADETLGDVTGEFADVIGGDSGDGLSVEADLTLLDSVPADVGVSTVDDVNTSADVDQPNDGFSETLESDTVADATLESTVDDNSVASETMEIGGDTLSGDEDGSLVDSTAEAVASSSDTSTSDQPIDGAADLANTEESLIDQTIDSAVEALNTDDALATLTDTSTSLDSWTESTITSDGGLYDDLVDQTGVGSDTLSDPTGTVSEGISVLDVNSDLDSGGMGSLFG